MRTFAASVAAVCLALGGCAQGATGGSASPASGGGSVSTPAAQSSPTEPTPPMPTRPVKPPPGLSAAPITVTGTVSGGVEAGCLLLDNYLLVGGPPALLHAGARVTVTGRLQPDMMTTCQQGIPLVVETAEPA